MKYMTAVFLILSSFSASAFNVDEDTPRNCGGPRSWQGITDLRPAQKAMADSAANPAQAEKDLQEYLDKHPRNGAALEAIAIIQNQQGEGAAAQANVEAALAEGRRYGYLSYWLNLIRAHALYLQRKNDEALALMERLQAQACMASWPSQPNLMLADLLRSAGRLDEAAVITSKLARNGGTPDIWVMDIELQCVLKHYKACAESVVNAAYSTDFPKDKYAWLSGKAQELARSPEASPVLVEAQSAGVFDALWNIYPKGPSENAELVPLNAITPVYPKAAVIQGLGGSVEVRITVGPDGKVTDAKVVQAVPEKIFDESALTAARAGIFRPLMINGKAVSQTGIRRFNFSLSTN